MNNKILELYKNINLEMDFNILNEVDYDNVFSKLNQFTGGHFSYDVDITQITGSEIIIVKVTLYTPVKVAVGFSNVAVNQLNMGVRQAIIIACENGFDIKEKTVTTSIVENTQTRDIAATTLEELEEIEKEMANSQDIPVVTGKDIEFKADEVAPTPANKFGIREDQIFFMKKFQEMLSIDTTEKFDEYVKAWAGTQSVYYIQSKNQLIGCGAEAVDAFILWVKEVYSDNVSNNNFVCPNDEEWNQCVND